MESIIKYYLSAGSGEKVLKTKNIDKRFNNSGRRRPGRTVSEIEYRKVPYRRNKTVVSRFDSPRWGTLLRRFRKFVLDGSGECIRGTLLCRHVEWLLIVGRKIPDPSNFRQFAESTAREGSEQFLRQDWVVAARRLCCFLFPVETWKRGNIGKGLAKKDERRIIRYSRI